MLNYEIDIADFPCADMDEPPLNAFQSEPILNKSYSSFLNTTMGVHGKFDKPELPEKADGLNWASWYIKVINPYVPILHEPTFMALVRKSYMPLYEYLMVLTRNPDQPILRRSGLYSACS